MRLRIGLMALSALLCTSVMAQENKDRKDGGGMTAKEKAKINAKQNKLSQDIYKEKHDAQTKKK